MKNPFSKRCSALLLIALLFLVGCNANNTPENGTSPTRKGLSEADARRIALRKANLDTATFTKQEYDAGDMEYEFEFHTEAKEYDCSVNAVDGSILAYSVENREISD